MTALTLNSSVKRCCDLFVSIDTSMKPHSEAGCCLENPGGFRRHMSRIAELKFGQHGNDWRLIEGSQYGAESRLQKDPAARGLTCAGSEATAERALRRVGRLPRRSFTHCQLAL